MNRSTWITVSIFALLLLVTLTSLPTEGVQAGSISLQPPLIDEPGNNQLPPIAPGVVLVGLKSDVAVSEGGLSTQADDPSLDAALAPFDVQNIEPVFPGTEQQSLTATSANDNEIDLSRIYRVHLPSDANVLQAVQELQANPAVAYAEPDYQAHLIATPNDSLYSGQWGLSQINAAAAWDVVTGTTDVVIAVVDSGIDSSHPDLAGQLWINPGEIAGNGIDDDNNGCIDDINGWNILEDNADLDDNTGHGTEVAGIIAATTNNSTGVAGVCWNCRLMTVKVTQPGGVANYSDIAAGIVYASQKGAEVINLSVGGYSDSTTLKTAIEAAAQTAVIVGGSGNDNKSDRFYPAAYDDYVLAVAGTANSDTKVGTSNYGTWVDVSAPGEAITTTFSGGGFGSTSGTSMAAPFASGVAGLLRSLHPDWSANQTRAQIVQTADNIDGANPSYAGQLGNGRINAQSAVNTTPQPELTFFNYIANGELNGKPDRSEIVNLFVNLSNEWNNASNVQGTLTTTDGNVAMVTSSATFGNIGAYATQQNVNGFVFNVAENAPYNHPIAFNLNLVADGGYSVTIPFTMTTANGVQNVSGIINTDTMWTNDKTYVVGGDVLVNAGVTLTIQPGTVVKFESGKYLRIDGTLIAQGTANEPILFTSNQPDPPLWGDWGQLLFNSSASFDSNGNYLAGNILEYAIVEYANGVSGRCAVNAQGTVYVHHTIIQYTPCAIGGKAVVDSSIIRYNGIGAMLSTPGSLKASLVISNHNGALQVQDGTQAISNTLIYNDRGICEALPLSPALGVICLREVDGLRANNIVYNIEEYDLNVRTSSDIVASQNYWGTTNTSLIDQRIYDKNDNFDRGLANYVPILNAPEPTAPAFLWQLSLNPGSPVGIQRVTFNLTFSRPMDQSLNPTVTFGSSSPYDAYNVVDNAQWLDDTHWQATYDFTSLVPRGTHTIRVSGARGTDGLEIPPDTRFNFVVDYAGQITDQTPPNPPGVFASGKPDDVSYVEAAWQASDPDSSIIGYRYAVGSAPGAVDIINWTTTTGTSLSRTGLGLIQDRQYWVAVQAQNVGGLWSTSGYRDFVAGQEQTYEKVFMPVIIKP